MSKKGGVALQKDAPWRVGAARPIPRIHHSLVLRVAQKPHTNYACSVMKDPDPLGNGLATGAIVEAAGPECIVPGQMTPIRLLGVKEAESRRYSELLAESKRNSETRLGASLHMEAALVMKKMWKWDDRKKWIGSVPGIYVGDEFQWRAELRVIGLHSQFNSGVDYVLNKDGVKVAVSVVASGRYSNRIKPFEVIEYCGQGGNPSCFDRNLIFIGINDMY